MVVFAIGEDTPTRILKATRRALIEHGYGNLTMSKVAAELDGSQGLIHYHFDSREALLAALLEREHEKCVAFFGTLPDDPEERLDRLMDAFVREFHERVEKDEMTTPLLELSAAATDSEPIQTALRNLNAVIREQFEQTIEDGIKAGVFEPVDSAAVARLLMAGADSAEDRWVVGETDEIPAIADALETYVLDEVRR